MKEQVLKFLFGPVLEGFGARKGFQNEGEANSKILAKDGLWALELSSFCDDLFFEVLFWACFGRFWAPRGLRTGRGSVQQNFGKRWALGVEIKVIL